MHELYQHPSAKKAECLDPYQMIPQFDVTPGVVPLSPMSPRFSKELVPKPNPRDVIKSNTIPGGILMSTVYQQQENDESSGRAARQSALDLRGIHDTALSQVVR